MNITLNAARCKAVLPPMSRASIRLLSTCNNFLHTYKTAEKYRTLKFLLHQARKFMTYFYMSR
jgi:hypothetical protein